MMGRAVPVPAPQAIAVFDALREGWGAVVGVAEHVLARRDWGGGCEGGEEGDGEDACGAHRCFACFEVALQVAGLGRGRGCG